MSDDRPETGAAAGDELLFYEQGGSSLWLLAGPIAGVTMLALQRTAGHGLQPMVPLLFTVVITGFLALQLKAARVHTSVELTRDILREGTEVTPVSQIVGVFPEPEFSVKSGEDLEKWQTARVLGELEGVPKRRTAVGIALSGDRVAQAWARDDSGLRAALTALIEARSQ